MSRFQLVDYFTTEWSPHWSRTAEDWRRYYVCIARRRQRSHLPDNDLEQRLPWHPKKTRI